MNHLKDLIRAVPDYPKPGILFYDLTTLMRNPAGFHELVDNLCDHYAGNEVDVVVGIEARGFILAPALAFRLNAGFVPVRKPKKLPGKTVAVTYQLEYGTDTLEIHEDALRSRGYRVLTKSTDAGIDTFIKQQGRSLREIGTELGISNMKVSRILKDCNGL